jgi:hypothetical protein
MYKLNVYRPLRIQEALLRDAYSTKFLAPNLRDFQSRLNLPSRNELRLAFLAISNRRGNWLRDCMIGCHFVEGAATNREYVVPIILYHRKPDGLIYYERAASLPSANLTTQRLSFVGPDSVPDAPASAATPREHNAWLQRCRDAGCAVKVEALNAEQE